MTDNLPGNEEDAMDVADVREAQRIIAALRRRLLELEDEARPLPNEFSVLLDAEHATKVRVLFEQRQLIPDQDEDWEVEEALAEFVQEWIDVHWDTVLLDQGKLGCVTPSA